MDYARHILSCKYCNILLHDFITLLVIKSKQLQKRNFTLTTRSYLIFEQLGVIFDRDPNFHTSTCNDILLIF